VAMRYAKNGVLLPTVVRIGKWETEPLLSLWEILHDLT
jgi:hypothetical protein